MYVHIYVHVHVHYTYQSLLFVVHCFVYSSVFGSDGTRFDENA